MDRVGVRELRQHASRYLARVAGGESLEVTDRGRAVARLVPVVADPWEDLLTSGRVLVPEDASDLLDEKPVDYGLDASKELNALRRHER
jgi:prevent-host-death family protein